MLCFLQKDLRRFFWKDGSRAAEAAELMKITAPELRELGIVDRVIPETFNGEQLPRYKVAHIMKKR